MNNRPISEIQQEIIDEFEMLGDWSEKYQHLIELGKKWPGLPESLHTEENKVRGCQSNVWLVSRVEGDQIIFEGDSDALIVKGLVALLLRVYSGHTPDEILSAGTEFLDETGLQANLSPTRNNGLSAMLKQIKFYAIGYKAKMESASKQDR